MKYLDENSLSRTGAQPNRWKVEGPAVVAVLHSACHTNDEVVVSVAVGVVVL